MHLLSSNLMKWACKKMHLRWWRFYIFIWRSIHESNGLTWKFDDKKKLQHIKQMWNLRKKLNHMTHQPQSNTKAGQTCSNKNGKMMIPRNSWLFQYQMMNWGITTLTTREHIIISWKCNRIASVQDTDHRYCKQTNFEDCHLCYFTF